MQRLDIACWFLSGLTELGIYTFMCVLSLNRQEDIGPYPAP